MKQFSKDLGNVCLAPKGKWSKEQEYERLALVYNARDNLSYVAKINVPSGVDIENREYWQPMNATGYADNNFINLTAENENGTITAYESIEEAIATIVPINRRAGATLSFYNLNSDRLDRQAEFELWQFNSTDLANWENKDYWNNIYYNWNVFAGWYVGADALNNHVKIPNVGQYAYVGSNLNDAILYQCRTNGTWTNTGIKVRNYISVVVSGNITIGENGNWFSDSEDTGIPATPAVDEQLDNIIMQLQQHATEINSIKEYNENLQDQITSNDNDITNLTAKHESLSRTVQGIAATGGASTATNVTYDNTNSGMTAENIQDAVDNLAKEKADSSDITKQLDKVTIKDEDGTVVDTPFRYIQNEEFIFANVDSENRLLFGIKWDGTPVFSKTSVVEDKLQSQVNLLAERVATIIGDDDTTNIIDTMNELKKFFAEIENTETLTGILDNFDNVAKNLDNVAKNLDKTTIKDEEGNIQDTPFRVIESPEFLKAITDSEDRFLCGIKKDGSVEWSKGIPSPIRSKLQEIVNQCQQDKTDVLESINYAKEELSASINSTNNAVKAKQEYFDVNLYGKSVSILGDSLSTFTGYNQKGNATFYPNETNNVTTVEQTWWMKLITDANAKLEINNSHSGATVSGTENSSYVARVENLGDPQYIIIHGGTNDYWRNVPVGELHFDVSEDKLNANEFSDAYDLMVRKAMRLYSNANIITVIPHILTDSYANPIINITKKYGLFACVDLRKFSFNLVSGHYQIDGMATVEKALLKCLFINKNALKMPADEYFKVIENDEFIHAITDSEGRVLFGIKRDTSKPFFPLNEMYHVEQNEEFFAVWLDADNHVLLGIRRDGQIIGEIHAVNALKQVISQLQSDVADLQEKVGTIDTNLKELLDIFSLQENPEYMAVETDADGKVLSATYNDGSHYSHNLKSETIDAKVDKKEGKSLIDADVADAHSTLEDPEGRTEITLDADKKVMSYRDSSGKKHEYAMEVTNLEVSNLNLKGNSVNNIQDALKANGFDVKTPIDWSDSSFIQIPEPRFAIINITNIDSMPTTKTQNKKAFLEFWDMQGNYFKKHSILNAQGNSSMGFVKKNVAIDFCDDEWIGDDTPKVRIGNWVPQDSFHMKAYYTDFFRGVGAVSYKLYDQIVRTRGNMYDRPWKKALLDMSKIGTTTKSLGNPHVGDYELLTDTGARCFPDGFPVAIYLNGEFYGIFSFQLKKHRDNYHMDKSTAEHVHLDGTINYNILWNGTIVWGTGDNGFEVRNPKNLYAIGGNKYDADIKQEEIAGEDEVNSWIAAGQLPDGTVISSKIKKNLQMTAKVKKYIQDFANTINIIKTAASTYETSSKTEEDLKAFKAVFEKYYDVENLIDYLITIDILGNGDSLRKNWQWFTYNGIKWWVGLYDCDGVFGAMHLGDRIGSPIKSHLGNDLQLPTGFILKYYNDVLEKRYSQLADVGIISSDNIFSLLQDWCMRIGTDFFKEEYKKWADSPCIADSIVRSEYWEAVLDGSGNPQKDTSETFDAAHAYNVGDVVSFGLNAQMGYFKYKCIKATSALSANIPHTVSAYSPISKFKHCDNIYRVQKWIEQNTANMDKVYNYTRNN